MTSELIILILCIMFSAFFAAVETAFTATSYLKVSQLIDKKVPGAKLIKRIKDEPGKFLSTVLIGNNTVNIAASALATSIIMNFFEARGETNMGIILGTATGLMTFFILVFGEIIPKSVAIRNAEKLSLIFALPFITVLTILTPVTLFLTWISTPFVLLFGGKMPGKGSIITEEDLKYIIAASEKEGLIERKEHEMISSIFEFGDTPVKEVMTPRPDVKAVEDSSSVEDLLNLIKETGHSRILVYENNLDNVVGVVYAKDLLDCKKTDPIRDFMRSVIFIPEGKKIDELLHQMQANRTHIAVVVDEYGATSGIVTMEDLIEEIVGEIHDEFERGEKRLKFVKTPVSIEENMVGG